jgi:Rrf2 family protein
MKIAAQEEYAIRCLGQLARSDSKTTISQIAQQVGLSEENTAKIMARLRQLGLVRSLRGKEGGYLLARPAAQISVAEVLEGISGDIFELERCASGRDGKGCVYHKDCGIRPVWLSLGELVHDFLNAITLADVLSNETDVGQQVTQLAAGMNSSHLPRRLPPHGGQRRPQSAPGPA